jgi:hypothetical protein
MPPYPLTADEAAVLAIARHRPARNAGSAISLSRGCLAAIQACVPWLRRAEPIAHQGLPRSERDAQIRLGSSAR